MGRAWELPLYGPNLQTPARLSPTALPMLVLQETTCRDWKTLGTRPPGNSCILIDDSGKIQNSCILIDDSGKIQTTRLEFNHCLQNVETYRLLYFFAKNVQQLQPHPWLSRDAMNIIKFYFNHVFCTQCWAYRPHNKWLHVHQHNIGHAPLIW